MFNPYRDAVPLDSFRHHVLSAIMFFPPSRSQGTGWVRVLLGGWRVRCALQDVARDDVCNVGGERYDRIMLLVDGLPPRYVPVPMPVATGRSLMLTHLRFLASCRRRQCHRIMLHVQIVHVDTLALPPCRTATYQCGLVRPGPTPSRQRG